MLLSVEGNVNMPTHDIGELAGTQQRLRHRF
jgi:hypothetical protein